MSVATVSPFQRKRLCEEETWDCSSGPGIKAGITKKARLFGPGPVRYSQVDSNQQASLQLLFPDMDSQTISMVLNDCSGNMDLTIQRLGELKLGGAASRLQPHGRSDEACAKPAEATAPEEAPCSHGLSAEIPSTSGPETGVEWVNALVSEMSAAKDMDDARQKAAVVLQNFESFVKGRSKAEIESSLKVGDLQKDIAILKKAVQIQAAKLQEKAQQGGELAELRQVLAQHQEKIRCLEMNNYSLTLHLARATGGSQLTHGQGPDIF